MQQKRLCHSLAFLTFLTFTTCKFDGEFRLIFSQVNHRLRVLANSKGSEGEMFHKLANSVEDFTTRLLDPMQSDQLQREGFGYFILDDILDDAIDLEQKKVMLKIK